MAKFSTVLELYCPGLFADPGFATWVDEWAGRGLATWHCRDDEPEPPGEWSDVFVTYYRGEGDRHPDNEGGMPRAAWDFVTRKAREHRLDAGLVRLINCVGSDPADDYQSEAVSDSPVFLDAAGAE